MHAVIVRVIQVRTARRRWLLHMASVPYPSPCPETSLSQLLWHRYPFVTPVTPCTPDLEAIEIEVNDRRGIQGQKLADDQAADDSDAQRVAQLRAGTRTEC